MDFALFPMDYKGKLDSSNSLQLIRITSLGTVAQIGVVVYKMTVRYNFFVKSRTNT
jgi:hypothetical protein